MVNFGSSVRKLFRLRACDLPEPGFGNLCIPGSGTGWEACQGLADRWASLARPPLSYWCILGWASPVCQTLFSVLGTQGGQDRLDPTPLELHVLVGEVSHTQVHKQAKSGC